MKTRSSRKNLKTGSMPKKLGFLGIYHGHNATAALLDDRGRVLICVSEERFTNKKSYTGFPYCSIRYILQQCKKKIRIEKVGLPFKYMNVVFLSSAEGKGRVEKINRLLSFARLLLLRFNREIHNLLYGIYTEIIGKRMANNQRRFTSLHLKIPLSKVYCWDHHLCHAYAAYYLSPFNKKDALVLTLDGEGDKLCATVNTVKKGGNFQTLARTPLGNSLGWIYMDLTKYLGMNPNEHEYKVMGLAPYAKEKYGQLVYERIRDWIAVDGLKFKAKFDTHLSYLFLKKELEGFRFDNIAWAFQKLLEDKICEWVQNCIRETKLATVCCGGGVFMNVKANMRISQLPEVNKLWIMPSAGDESTAIGAAIASYLEYCRERGIKARITPIRGIYWGPAYSNSEIRRFLQKGKWNKKFRVEFYKDIEKVIANLLAKGEIVARLAGRMEWGARALGNRSILANPSNPDIVRTINEYVKARDFWMPFAGSILEERADEYIVNPKKIVGDYMIMAYDSTSLARKELRAALHPYDFTIRPQIVRKEWNPSYYRIIKEFEKITGIGGVLNTSFNLHGYPIVKGPKEAMFVFENSEIRYLAMENYIISKE
jgi:carbamoyltransferase